MDRLTARYIEIKTREEGQTVIEYALILAFVALVAAVLAAGGDIEQAVSNAFDSVDDLFGGA
jgi:Flp pilus assembly pilin Flp